MSSSALSAKYIIEVDPAYVDVVEDVVYIGIVLIFAWVFTALRGNTLTLTSFQAYLTSIVAPLIVGLLVYHLIVRRFVAFMPTAGTEQIYMGLRKY